MNLLENNDKGGNEQWFSPPDPIILADTGCPEDLRERVIWITHGLVLHHAYGYLNALEHPAVGAGKRLTMACDLDAFRRDVTETAINIVRDLRLAV